MAPLRSDSSLVRNDQIGIDRQLHAEAVAGRAGAEAGC